MWLSLCVRILLFILGLCRTRPPGEGYLLGVLGALDDGDAACPPPYSSLCLLSTLLPS